MIACVMVPYLATAIERQRAPELASLPLVLEAARQVFAVSPEAAQFGVKAGMSLRQAQALCPKARFMPAQPDHYRQAIRAIRQLLTPYTPKVEADPDDLCGIIYADMGQLTAADQLDIANQIIHTIRLQLHLSVALGLALGKFPAYLAASSIGLSRVLFITPGQEGGFLAPFPVSWLPLDQELAHRLQLLGLRSLGQFARLPSGAVLTQFGAYGGWLHQLARGYDNRPVLEHPSQPILEATHHFEEAVADRHILTAVIQHMLAKLAGRLAGRFAQMVEITLDLADDAQWTAERLLRQPTGNIDRLLRAIEEIVTQAQLRCGVTAITLKLSGLITLEAEQLHLFGTPTAIPKNVTVELVSKLVARYGPRPFYEVVITKPLSGLLERRFAVRPFKKV